MNYGERPVIRLKLRYILDFAIFVWNVNKFYDMFIIELSFTVCLSLNVKSNFSIHTSSNCKWNLASDDNSLITAYTRQTPNLDHLNTAPPLILIWKVRCNRRFLFSLVVPLNVYISIVHIFYLISRIKKNDCCEKK